MIGNEKEDLLLVNGELFLGILENILFFVVPWSPFIPLDTNMNKKTEFRLNPL